jgi:hypothetical protein
MQAKLGAPLRNLGCEIFATSSGAAGYHKRQISGENSAAAGYRCGEYALRITHYAWRSQPRAARGLALSWWLKSLESPRTKRALIEDQAGGGF